MHMYRADYRDLVDGKFKDPNVHSSAIASKKKRSFKTRSSFLVTSVGVPVPVRTASTRAFQR